ncbi:hypothetical protein ZWY2020_035793 [Hordeum vulgare]|nr:hypothetical protein ZWY2020_035793 [Hordeum vulgare]
MSMETRQQLDDPGTAAVLPTPRCRTTPRPPWCATPARCRPVVRRAAGGVGSRAPRGHRARRRQVRWPAATASHRRRHVRPHDYGRRHGHDEAAAGALGPASRRRRPAPQRTAACLGADAGGNAFPWSNAMLQWQRTGFHFSREELDERSQRSRVLQGMVPPLYQYNPDGAIWGNKIAWAAPPPATCSVASPPIIMSPDQWYDINGV